MATKKKASKKKAKKVVKPKIVPPLDYAEPEQPDLVVTATKKQDNAVIVIACVIGLIIFITYKAFN